MRNVLSVIFCLLVAAFTPVAALAAHVNVNIGIPLPAVPVPVVTVPVAPVPVAPMPVAPAPQVDVNVEAPPPLDFAQPPDMAVVPSGEAAVYVVPNTYGVYFYNNSWFRFYNGAWFQASAWNAGWVPVGVGIVPQVVVGVAPEYGMVLPVGYQRIHYGEFYQNWRNWERNRYWQTRDWFRHERGLYRDRLHHIERERGRWARGEGHRPPGFGRHEPGHGGPGARPDHRPGARPDHRPGNRPGRQPGAMPGRQPGRQPGAMPGRQPGRQPGAMPGRQPGHQPGAGPGRQPGRQGAPKVQAPHGGAPGQHQNLK